MTVRRLGSRVVAILLLGMAAGCSTNTSIFTPASTNARAISELTLVVFGVSAIVFLIVESVLIYSIVRFRQKKGSDPSLPRQVEGNQRLEFIWTAIPAVMLVVIFIFSLKTLRTISNPAGSVDGQEPANTIHVRVVGHQWYWQVDFPDQEVVTANELHIPINTPVKVELLSADVIHSFWVPQLGGKTDAIPGTTNIMHFQADTEGTYTGQCAEFCGAEHSMMRFLVIVESKEKFDAWLQNQQQPIQASLSSDAAQGQQLFLAGTCGACHTLNGTKAKGMAGPNLTHFASRQTFAGASLENNAENLRQWLTDPQALKPGNLMPNLKLKPADIELLIAFLQSLQ